MFWLIYLLSKWKRSLNMSMWVVLAQKRSQCNHDSIVTLHENLEVPHVFLHQHKQTVTGSSTLLWQTTISSCHVINQMRRPNPISILACMLALLSLQLGQDIFVWELRRGERVKEVRETCFNNSNRNLHIIFCCMFITFTTAFIFCTILTSAALFLLKVLHHVHR